MGKYKIGCFLFLLFCCISCNSDNNVTKKECLIKGLLCYGRVSNGWEIHEMEPNTIDEVNIYIVKQYNINLPSDTTADVSARGLSYPSSDKAVLPAGTTLYNIEVKSLIYNIK